MIQQLTAPDLSRALVAYLARNRGYVWRDGQYYSAWNGRPVRDETVRRAVEDYNNRFLKQDLKENTEKLLDGRWSLDKWQRENAKAIKEAWVVNVRIGRGPNIDFSDFGRAGGRLQFQYRKLDQFAQDIKAGALTPAQIQARIQLYGNAVHMGYWDGVTAAKGEAGFEEEKRVAQPGRVCRDCLHYESLGWQPLNSLPSPGHACQCHSNCRCSKIFRKRPVEA